MKKRFICMIFALIFVFGAFPLALFAENESFITVISNGERRNIGYIEEGDDLLFSASDLAWMSGFSLYEDEDFLLFERGFKTVEVDCSASKLKVVGYTSPYTLNSDAVYEDGCWYISATSLLPWLNVCFAEQYGNLYVQPNSASLWDIIQDFDYDDYDFSFSDCCEALGINSKKIMALAYIKANTWKIFLDIDFDFNGKTYRGQERYFQLFEDIIADNSVTDVAKNELVQNALFATSFMAEITGVVSVLMPEIAALGEIFGTVETTTQNLYEIALFHSLFANDNNAKIDMFKSIVDNRDYTYNKNMVAGAQEAIDTYTNYWIGLLTHIKYDVVEVAGDSITSNIITDAVGLRIREDKPLAERIDRISPYSTIAEVCQKVMRRGYSGFKYDTISKYVNHAMMYLYCVEENYRTMAHYVYNNAYYIGDDYTIYKDYLAIADNAELMNAKFLNALNFLEQDSCDFSIKKKSGEELAKLFKKLERKEPLKGIAATVEMAIYRAYLCEFGYYNGSCIIDADGDGNDEMLVMHQGDLPPSFIVMDPDRLVVDVFTNTGASADSYMRMSKDGKNCYVIYGYYSSMNQSEEYMGWNGREWVTLCAWYNDIKENSKGEFVDNTTYYVKGVEADKSEYDKAFAALNIDMDTPVAKDDGYTNQAVSGKTDEIFTALDEYFAGRENCVGTESSTDLNGDGKADRIYGLYNAERLWKNSTVETNTLGYEDFLTTQLSDLTIVVAESTKNGVKLRVCRADAPEKDDKFEMSGKNFIVGMDLYVYSPEGNAYTRAQ